MINRYLGSHGQGKAIRNSSIANGVFKIFGYTTFVYLFNTEGALLTNVLCSIIYCTTLIYYYQNLSLFKMDKYNYVILGSDWDLYKFRILISINSTTYSTFQGHIPLSTH